MPSKSARSIDKDKSTLVDADYERLGREIEHVIASSYTTTFRALFFSFLRGLVMGVGYTIGASLVLVLLLWLLSGLGHIPLIGDIFENAKHSIEQAPVR